MSLVFITLILLTGYCILDKKAPKQVEGYFPKFAIAFMVTFTILNEAIYLLYTILHSGGHLWIQASIILA